MDQQHTGICGITHRNIKNGFAGGLSQPLFQRGFTDLCFTDTATAGDMTAHRSTGRRGMEEGKHLLQFIGAPDDFEAALWR